MSKFVFPACLVALLASSALAQEPDPMQCQQIRQAVAQYGFTAARQHALQTYGPEAVRMGDKCFAKQIRPHSIRHRK
jgi:hypothetical protein